MSIILALSDTHLTGPLPTDNTNYYPDRLKELISEADLVLHAGDFESQEAYDALVKLCDKSECELWAIQGNPVISPAKPIYIKPGVKLPEKKADERFGIKIGLMHDANGSYDFSESIAAENAAEMILPSGAKGVDVLVFGHLHESIVVWNKNTGRKRRLLVCPGPGSSNAIDRNHKCPSSPTAAQLNIDREDISCAKIVSISWPAKI